MFSDQVGGEARPRGKMPRFNCFDPGRRDWTAACLMQVAYNVLFVLEFVDVVGSVTELLGSGCTGRLVVEVEIPESVGVACAFEHDIVILFDGEAVFGEAGFVAIVIEVSDGYESAV